MLCVGRDDPLRVRRRHGLTLVGHGPLQNRDRDATQTATMTRVLPEKLGAHHHKNHPVGPTKDVRIVSGVKSEL